MKRGSRVAILGSDGLLGEAIGKHYPNVVLKLNRGTCDLRDENKLTQILLKNNIDLVINCAARVGGIELNRKEQFRQFSFNTILSLTIINSCVNASVKELVMFSSNCIYPSDAAQPFKECDLFTGKPELTNTGYADAKRLILTHSKYAEQEHNIKVFHPIPCSLFGTNDNFSLTEGHLISTAIHKIFRACKENDKSVVFWGSGRPLREVMFADDMAHCIGDLIRSGHSSEPINIGSGIEVSVKDIVTKICSIFNYSGILVWDTQRPDGAMRKILDSTRFKAISSCQFSDFDKSLEKTIADFVKYYSSKRK